MRGYRLGAMLGAVVVCVGTTTLAPPAIASRLQVRMSLSRHVGPPKSRVATSRVAIRDRGFGAATRVNLFFDRTAGHRPGARPVDAKLRRSLSDVSASSPANAWAVGTISDSSGGHPVMLHWDGTAWHVGRTAARYSGGIGAVATLSKTQAWAVGYGPHRPLILHWNGILWRRQATPAKAVTAHLYGVTAIRRNDAWAVGTDFGANDQRDIPVILHWNGRTWKRTRCPAPPPRSYMSLYLFDVAASSARNVWAFGNYNVDEANEYPYILHWNGTQWTWHPRRVLTALGGTGLTNSTALVGRNQAWAVGDYTYSLVHWNGRRWHGAVTPINPFDVAVVSKHQVWITGTRNPYVSAGAIGYWNGQTWRSFHPIGMPSLTGVTAPASGSAWAVGGYQILHWNGVRWRRQAIPKP